MAFNPFDAFRKNAKPMMAALTIFVMGIFVLSSGGAGADFFDWIARLVGGKDQRGAMAGSIEGTEYYSRSLQELRQRRAAANSFMTAAVADVDRILLSKIKEDLDKNAIKDSEARDILEAAQFYRNQALFQQLRNMNIEFEKFFPNRPKLTSQLNRLRSLAPNDAIGDLQGAAAAYMSRNKESEKATEFAAMRRLSKTLNDDLRRLMNADDGMYFSSPNKTEEDALRFELFLRLADKMEIHFIPDDVKKLIAAETDRELTADTVAAINKMIQKNFAGFSLDQVMQAIGDEFRVMMVMKILGGSVYSGHESSPLALTPYEFYEYYKDHLAELTFEVVDAPVESFLSQVKEKPTEKELDSFFRKYSKVEADPARETPGFKEPRRVKLEYVAIDANKPIYREVLPTLQAISTIAGGYSATYLGVGAVPGMMEVAGPLLAEPLLVSEDKRSIEEMAKHPQPFSFKGHGFGPKPRAAEFLLRASDTFFANQFYEAIGLRQIADAARQLLPVSEPWMIPPRDSSSYNPLAIASLVGELVVPMNPAVNVSLAATGSHNFTDLIEIRDRVAFGMQMTMAPMSPAFYLGGSPLAAFGPAIANLPPEPLGVYAAERVATRNRVRAEHIAEKDLEGLVAKLNELHKNLEVDEPKKEGDAKPKTPPKLDPNKIDQANIAARTYVENWIKSHPGVETGKSSGLLNKYQLAEDPAMSNAWKELKDNPHFGRFVEGYFFSPSDTNYEANKFDKPLIPSDMLRQNPGLIVHKPITKPIYAIWKVDDREAKEYKSLDLVPQEMREEIIKAWKMEKARVLAQAAADEFAKSIQGLAKKELQEANAPHAFAKGLADAAAAAKLKLLAQPVQIAKLSKPPQPPQFQMNPQASDYRGPSITNREIKYPLGNAPNLRQDQRSGEIMAEQMLALRNKPLGEAIVIPNRPKDHFYIAILTNKQDLGAESFYEVFSKTNVPAANFRSRDILYQYALSDDVLKFRRDLIDRVNAEMKYKESDELKKMDRQQETAEQ